MNRRHFITGSLSVLVTPVVTAKPRWREVPGIMPELLWEPGDYGFVTSYVDRRTVFRTTIKILRQDNSLIRQYADTQLCPGFEAADAFATHKSILLYWAQHHGLL